MSQIDEIEIEVTEKELGRGSFGCVFVGVWKGAKVAVKRLHNVFFEEELSAEQAEALLGEFRREMNLLITLKHPNVLQFLSCSNVGGDDRRLQMVTELLHESLETRLERRERPIQDPLKLHVLRSIACGLRYLHERPKPIVHRDLATKNVLLSRDAYQVKIADYGLAKAVANLSGGGRSRKTTQFTPATEVYAAPEVFAEVLSEPSRDMFSYGVLALETVVGFMTALPPMIGPSHGSSLRRIIPEVERRREDLSRVADDHPMREIILMCIEDNAETRPTAKFVVANFPEYGEEEMFGDIAKVEEGHGEKRQNDGDDDHKMKSLQTSLTVETGTQMDAVNEVQAENERLKEEIKTVKCKAILKEWSLKTQLSKVRNLLLPQLWMDMPDLPVPQKHPLLAVVDGIFLLCCRLTKTVYMMDPNTCRVRNVHEHPRASEIDSMTADKGRCFMLTIYVDGQNTVTQLETFNPSDATWTDVATVPLKAAIRYSSLAVADDTVYVVGGLNKASVSVSFVFAFDLKSGTWTDMIPMPTERSACSCAVVDNSLYVAGGFTRTAVQGSLSSAFEVYSFKHQFWQKLNRTEYGVSIVAIRGTLLSVGGAPSAVKRESNEQDDQMRSTLRYDREKMTWTPLPSMITGKCMPGVCVVDGANSVIVGGGSNKKEEPRKDVESFSVRL
eukprot:m.311012 g.311012  ORF g.311012 m.311012 type:complete len:673 (+) comp58091_c0_seq1:65-2083(+)